jgi:hypothetical protein
MSYERVSYACARGARLQGLLVDNLINAHPRAPSGLAPACPTSTCINSLLLSDEHLATQRPRLGTQPPSGNPPLCSADHRLVCSADHRLVGQTGTGCLSATPKNLGLEGENLALYVRGHLIELYARHVCMADTPIQSVIRASRSANRVNNTGFKESVILTLQMAGNTRCTSLSLSPTHPCRRTCSGVELISF